MPKVEVQRMNEGEPYEFQVTVQEGGTGTQHRVTLRQADYERLSGGKASPEALVRASFGYLLEREPEESILRSFDLKVIGRQFRGVSVRSPGDCEVGLHFKSLQTLSTGISEQASWWPASWSSPSQFPERKTHYPPRIDLTIGTESDIMVFI